MNLTLILAAPALQWQAAFKKTKKKTDILTGITMLLMVEKSIRVICHSIYWYATLLKNIFLRWWIMKFYEKQWAMWENRDIKLGITETRRNYLVSVPKNHTTKFFAKYLLATEMKKFEILINKPIYLGLSILELSKILMYKFWHDQVKTKYCEKQNCITWIKTVSLYT